MRNDNEAKMKAILNELEDDFMEEEKDDKEEIEELIVEKELDKDEEVVEDAIEDEKESEEVSNDEENEKELDDEIQEETDIDEKELEEEKDEKDESNELDIKESPVRKMGMYLLDKLKKYKYVIILDIVVFLFLFFLIPAIIFEVKPIVWMTLFLVFTILPTISFYLGRLFQKYQILFSIPFFYLCILTVLDNCIIKDLYGITSRGALDKTPAWVDAIFVTFIIVFFQYIGLTAIDLARKCLKKKRTKEK